MAVVAKALVRSAHRARWRGVLFRVVALVLGCTLGALLAELGLRIIGYDGADERSLRVFDAKYGTVNADSWIFDFKIDPARHTAVDLRGQLIPLHKPADEQRVLFVGDSATEGAFVDPAQSYPQRFGQLLDARAGAGHKRVRVINAGVWGMTTIDEYHLLRDKLLPLAPDVVVIGLFMANDINWNLGHAQRRVRYALPNWLDAARQHSALVHFSFLRALAFNQRHRLIRSESFGAALVPVEVGLVDSYGLHMLSYPAGELALYMRKPSALADEAFGVLKDVLQQFVALGERNGFVVRVLLIPTPSATLGRLAILHYPDLLLDLRRQGIVIHEGDLDFGQPARRVLAACEQLGLTCIDPHARFAQLGLGAFFPGDEHPSVAGHDALAHALLEH